VRLEEAFFDEIDKIAKTIQGEFPFMKVKPPKRGPEPKMDPFKKPKEVHIGTMYKQNPEGMSRLAKTILDRIGRGKK
jgi:hypothetical protein